MATNMDLVSIATTFLVLYLSTLDTGNAGIIRRDVPPIAIPLKLKKPTTEQANSTQDNSTQLSDTQVDNAKAKSLNCTIEVVAFIPFTDKTNANETANIEPKKVVHESYPNPPAPTPPSPILITTTKAVEVTSEPEKNDDGTKKWGFDDKYLASQNKYATRRNVVFDVVAGDAMSFSNYNVLGHQEVTLHRKK